MRKSKFQEPAKPARSFNLKSSLLSFFDSLQNKDFFFEAIVLFYKVLYYENLFLEFYMKHFTESCFADWIPCLEFLEKKEALFFLNLVIRFFSVGFLINRWAVSFLEDFIFFLWDFKGVFLPFIFAICFYFFVAVKKFLVFIFLELLNIDSFWAFLWFFCFLLVTFFFFLKERIFRFLVYFRDRSKLLTLFCKNVVLDYHDFSIFHGWHRIFGHTWGCRYVYVEIIDDFITYWYRVYRRFVRTLTYPLPCFKKIALYLKKNFYFVRTRTWIILIGIIIAFICWSLMKYSYRKGKHYLLALSAYIFYRYVKEFLKNAEFDNWDVFFKDPATVYAHALIDLHDLTMWYIFVVLGIVCWSLYAILKNCVWNVANKNFGSSVAFYEYKLFSRLESVLVFIWFKLYILYVKDFFVWCNRYGESSRLLIYYYLGLDKSFEIELLAFVCGPKGFIEGIFFPKFFLSDRSDYVAYVEQERELGRDDKPIRRFRIGNLNFRRIYFYVKERYLDFRLFNISTYGEFYYDSFSELLAVRRFRHSTLLEIVWASIPTVIIVLILIPSLYLLYSAEEDLDPEFTLKVIGHQWYWSYEYVDSFDYFFGSSRGSVLRNLKFDSYLVLDEDLQLGEKRLLEVSNRVVLPTNVVLRILVSSGDVLHAWAVPEMGIKVDAVPGRLNQTLSIILRPGIFYGQCSELCGVAHGFMPIVVHAVTPREFGYWGFWQS